MAKKNEYLLMKMASKCGGKLLGEVIRVMIALGLLQAAGCQGNEPTHTAVYGYSKQRLPLLLPADSNYHESGAYFTLPQAQWLRIHCTGEVVQGPLIAPRDLDNVELFFDLGNQKRKAFGDGDDRHYVITRSPAKLVVQPANPTDGLRYTFGKAGPAKWYEIRIPWASLGYRPAVGQTFGFDCAATDNDTRQKDRMVFWHANDAEAFLNTALYGNLVLQRQAAATPTGTVGCPYTAVAPVLDGRVDSLWQRMPHHSLDSCGYGSRVRPENFAARFRTCWNQDNIFLLFEVRDDVDVFDGRAGQIRDYGWLEDAAGHTLWQLNSTAHHNGGALKNRVADTLLLLPAGTYLARYSTDESHSPERWDAPPPTARFYGMAIDEAKRPSTEKGRFYFSKPLSFTIKGSLFFKR